jgi:predicted phosphoribosyltransferase
MIFRDRAHAGRELAAKLSHYANQPGVLVLALPRGGVVVAFEVARALNAQLDVFLVRKLGVPGQRELALGAIASGGIRVLNEEVLQALPVSEEMIEYIAAAEQRELERREQVYRGGRPAPEVRGRTIILVDDGIATGSTMRAAVRALRQQQPERVVVATPVAPAEACQELAQEADEVVCLDSPEPFYAISQWYEDFAQTSDDEVRDLLERASGARAAGDCPTQAA